MYTKPSFNLNRAFTSIRNLKLDNNDATNNTNYAAKKIKNPGFKNTTKNISEKPVSNVLRANRFDSKRNEQLSEKKENGKFGGLSTDRARNHTTFNTNRLTKNLQNTIAERKPTSKSRGRPSTSQDMSIQYCPRIHDYQTYKKVNYIYKFPLVGNF